MEEINTNKGVIDIDHMPVPLAEFVDADAVDAATRKYGTRCKPAGLFHSAWNHTEFALNRSANDQSEVGEWYFEYANNLTAMIIDHPKAHQDDRLGALVLSSYLPVFRKRSQNEVITTNDCEDIYHSLGAAIAYMEPLRVDEPPQWTMAETAVLALSARTFQPDLLLYPASPREETSKDMSYNHDSYFYVNRNKIPVQQKLIKTQKTYDEWVNILTLQPLVEKGLRKTAQLEIGTAAEQLNYLLSLIVAEHTEQQLDRDERAFLNHMSAAVVSHRWAGASDKPKAA